MNCEYYFCCKVIDYIVFECVCLKMSDCLLRKDEVCGSDGKIYFNDCVVCVEVCMKGMDIFVVNFGFCGKFKVFIICWYYCKIYDY